MKPRIRGYNPTDRELAAWVRDMEDFARNAEDRDVVTGSWNSANAPITVATPNISTTPSEVRLLRATSDGGATFVSGAPISWNWDRQRLSISAIGTLTSSTDYDLVLAVVR